MAKRWVTITWSCKRRLVEGPVYETKEFHGKDEADAKKKVVEYIDTLIRIGWTILEQVAEVKPYGN